MGGASMQARPTGFEAVYRREFSFVWATARRLGVRPAALDDAVQDVFLTAYRRWDDLDDDRSPRAWLYGVTRRVASRYRRSEARTARRRSALSRRQSDAETFAELEGAHDVDAVLAGLESGRREVFVMSELLEMTGPEIAAELGIPLNTVYSRLRLARRQLSRKVTSGPGSLIDHARRTQRPPRGQARRTWAVLLPSLGRSAALGGPWVAGKLSAVTAAGLAGVLVATAGWVLSEGDADAGSRPAEVVDAGERPATADGGERSATADGGERTAAAAEEGERSATADGGERTAAAAEEGERSVGIARPNSVVRRETSGSASPASPLPTVTAGSTPLDSSLPRARARSPVSSRSGPGPPPAAEREPAAPGSRAASSPAPGSPLTAEVTVLERATEALRRGDTAGALRWLAEHEQSFPEGRLVDVRKATRIRVLCRQGKPEQARAEAAVLRREHPGSAVVQGLVDSCDDV